MGTGRFTATDWDSFTTTRTTGKSRDHIFTSRGMDSYFDPRNVLRESRDSNDNPNSTPIIVGLDVSGSMHGISEAIARDGLKTLFTEIYTRKPVNDPCILFSAIGDVLCDSAPLQVSQFESDIRIADQLTKLWLEGGGGGNSCESYTLPWYFAAMHTSLDSFDKRNKRGYLITFGDEEPNAKLTSHDIERVFGTKQAPEVSSEEILEIVERKFNVFHIIIEQGSHCQSVHRKDSVVSKWRNLLGQRALLCSDYTKLAEIIVSAITVVEGEDAASVSKSWSGDTSLVVSRAIGDLTVNASRSSVGGLIRL